MTEYNVTSNQKGKSSRGIIIGVLLVVLAAMVLMNIDMLRARVADGSIWTPFTAFAVVGLVFGIGEILAIKTKGRVSFLIFASLIFLGLFWTKAIPADIVNRTNIPPMIGTIGIGILVVNLGTTIDLSEIRREWRTVVVALSGIVGILAVALTIGSLLFGREMALTAAPPISGGMVAAILVQQAATAASKPEIAGFAMLVYASQKFVGLPIATWAINKELESKMISGDFNQGSVKEESVKSESVELLLPKKYRTLFINFASLAVVVAVAQLFAEMTAIPGSKPTNYIVHPAVSYLLFGLLATKVGFLPKKTLTKTMSKGFILYAALFLLPGSLAKISPAMFLQMLPAIFGMLILCALGIAIISVLVGKVFNYSKHLSIACAITCMLGYPVTEILTNECVGNIKDANAEQKEQALNYMLPKIVIAGFATVTIASVIFAAVVAPIIF